MVFHVVPQFLVLVLVTFTASQFMPPQSFSYQFQQGHPQMPMMHSMPNGPAMMPANGGHVMQMPNGPPMMPHMPRLPGMSLNQMNMPMPMVFPMNQGRLPMVVTPHHSKKADKHRKKNRKPKRKRINMDSSGSEGSCSESVEMRSRNKFRSSPAKKRREVLTPVVSYVTKDGFVVYQKKIKKDKAKDWLEMAKGDDEDSQEYKDKFKYKPRDHDH